MHRMAARGTLVLGMLVLAGCSGSSQDTQATATDDPDRASVTASAAPTSVEEGSVQPSSAPTDAVNDATGELIDGAPAPTWDATSRASAVKAGEAAFAAFAAPDKDYDAWWSALEPLFTQEAAEIYAFTDPANVPARKATGDGTLVDESSAYLATIEIPYDAGPYEVKLSRESAEAPWLVFRISPKQDSE